MRTADAAAVVSIHAPVKGATGYRHRQYGRLCVSIHAPVKGATIREGFSRCGTSVSIHAPVKGATIILFAHVKRCPGFNPRPREGGDDNGRHHGCIVAEFQSTPP